MSSTEPRPYDINDPKEIERLYRELRGYMRICVKCGTDTKGRKYAYEALVKLAPYEKEKEKEIGYLEDVEQIIE